MKTAIFKTSLAILVLSTSSIYAQQWAGSTTTASNINRDGNVAIGTTTPTAKLHVRGSLRFEALTLNNTAPRFLMMDTSGNASYKNASTLLTNSCVTTDYLTKSDASGNLTCSNILDSSGSIHLGSSTQPTLFYNYESMFLMNNAGAINRFFWLINENKSGASQLWKMGSTTSTGSNIINGLSFIENNTTRFVIQDGTGKVGIGTTTLSCSTCDIPILPKAQ